MPVQSKDGDNGELDRTRQQNPESLHRPRRSRWRRNVPLGSSSYCCCCRRPGFRHSFFSAFHFLVLNFLGFPFCSFFLFSFFIAEIRALGNRLCWKVWLEGTSCLVDPVISYFVFVLVHIVNAFSFILCLVDEKKWKEENGKLQLNLIS